MPHTPEPWYAVHIPATRFTPHHRFLITVDPDPKNVLDAPLIAIITALDPDRGAANAQLFVRAPRLARVLNTLLTEVSDGFSSEGTTPMALAMQDAAALVRELREAGAL